MRGKENRRIHAFRKIEKKWDAAFVTVLKINYCRLLLLLAFFLTPLYLATATPKRILKHSTVQSTN